MRRTGARQILLFLKNHCFLSDYSKSGSSVNLRREVLSTSDLNMSGDQDTFESLEAARDTFEKSYIAGALARHSFNVTHTARSLGISRQHLQTLIKKHEIARYEDPGD